MPTIVHAADLHLDSPVRLPSAYRGALSREALPAALRHATRRAVLRLVELALRERAKLLIVAGDVFDRQADTFEAGEFFAGQMDRLHRAGVAVLVAAGNHDAQCPRALAGAARLGWFTTEAPETYRFDALGVAVHGQGLADPTEPADLVAGFPPPVEGLVNIGVLHTSLDGRTSRSSCAPTTTTALAARGYDYWALGHVHHRRVVPPGPGTPWIVFPGNLQGRGPHEPGGKGATVLTIADGRITRVAHRTLASLRWQRSRLASTGARAAAPVPVA